MCFQPSKPYAHSFSMQIIVSCQQQHIVDVADDATVESVKQFVASVEGVSLSYSG